MAAMTNRTKIKICGLTRPEDIQTVNICQPDYIGFVFADKSRRHVTVEQAADLKSRLSKDIMAIGVFVNEAKEQIAQLLECKVIDAAQLHGQESEAEVRWIKEQAGRPVIKAVSVQSRQDIDLWADSQADYLLFDNGAGGTGQVFDWSLLSGYAKPYFLAGGLNSSNVGQALAMNVYAVDVSGGVESGGRKDQAKIAEIIRIVRGQGR